MTTHEKKVIIQKRKVLTRNQILTIHKMIKNTKAELVHASGEKSADLDKMSADDIKQIYNMVVARLDELSQPVESA